MKSHPEQTDVSACHHKELTKRSVNQRPSSGETVTEAGTDERADSGDDGVHQVVAELLDHIGDTHLSIDDRVEVAETVTRELTGHVHQDNLQRPPPRVTGLEQRAVWRQLLPCI